MEKYFITGSSYFIDKNIKLFTPKNEDLEMEIFFGDELNKEDFLSYINSVDLFGSPKAAIIRNAGRIKDIEQLAEISMDENPDSYKVTLVGSVTVENGKIVAQNGDPVSEMVFQEIGNVGFNFKKEYFKNAVFSDGRFTADVTLPKQFMGNDNVDYSNMKVDVTYGVCLKTLALSYSMASGAQVTVNYDFQ